jgi:hypothetical protein
VRVAATGCVLSALASVGLFVVARRQSSGNKSDIDTTEHLIDAITVGLRIIRSAPRLRAILIREATFVFLQVHFGLCCP